jgi:ribosomal protein S18 acetylase RimI-like enzyme
MHKTEEDLALEEGIILANCIDSIFKNAVTEKYPELQIDVFEVDGLSNNDLEISLQLLDANLGDIYIKINGKNWKVKKRKEMREPGLVYVLLRNSNDLKFCGFISVKIINEDDLCVLYLYEIQLGGTLRNKGIGTFLMNQLDNVVKQLQNSKKLKKLWFEEYAEGYSDINDPDLELTGIGLTVFSSNVGAKKLYKRLGFVLHPSSPIEKELRNGKIIEPDYYMLEKKL